MKLLITLSLSLFLFSCTSTNNRESLGEFADNTVISTKVKSKLLANKKVSGTSVNVKSFKGNVILSGFVNSNSERKLALNIAKSVDGVETVKDGLVVKENLTE